MSLPGWNPRHGRAQPEVNQGCVPGGQVPVRTLQKRAFALRRTGRGLFLFPLMGTSWEQLADKGSDQGVPTWEQNGGNHGICGAAATRRRRHNGARHLASRRSTGGGEVRAQLKALAVLRLPSPTVPGGQLPPLRPQRAGRHAQGRPALALTLGSGAQDEGQLPRPPVRRLRLGR